MGTGRIFPCLPCASLWWPGIAGVIVISAMSIKSDGMCALIISTHYYYCHRLHMYSDSTLLVLKRTSLNSDSALLALNCLMDRQNDNQGWDRKYLKKEEDNLARERIDRASRERSDQVGGGCGRVAGPPPTVGTFGISGIKNSCFKGIG